MGSKRKSLGTGLSALNNISFEKDIEKKADSKNEIDIRNNEENYATAPYNFIEFPDKIVYRYDNIDELPKHNMFYENLKTGYISYKIENLSPIFIGGKEKEIEIDGKKEKETLFFTVNEKIVIPGSTIRGRVRSNAEVLSFSYPKYIEDRQFLYRGLADKSNLRDEYQTNLKTVNSYIDNEKIEVEKLENKVKVGFLFKDGDNKYKIKPCKKIKYKIGDETREKNFFVIDEFRLKEQNNISKLGRIKWMYNSNPEKVLELEKEIRKLNEDIQNIYEKNQIDKEIKIEIGSDYSKLTRKEIEEKEFFDNLKLKIINGENKEEIEKLFQEKWGKFQDKSKEWKKFKKDYRSSNINCCYEITENISVREENGGIYSIKSNSEENQGENVYLYNSNYFDGKRKHYIIPKEFEEEKLTVPDSVIYEYKKELKSKVFLTVKGEKKLKDEIKNFYQINDRGRLFFYKELDGKIIALGRTPFLRLSYNYSIHEMLNNNMEIKKDKLDYCDAIFGFTNGEVELLNRKNNYKGRVDFLDLKLIENSKKRELPRLPKNGKMPQMILSSPRATSFQLYLKQTSTSINNLNTYNNKQSKLRGQKFYWQRYNYLRTQEAKSYNMRKNFRALDKHHNFEGKIYFENLSEDELGLLLLSLKYIKNTHDNIGMAKPYGYGKINVKDIKLVIEKKKDSFNNFFKNNEEIILNENERFEELKNNFKINCLDKYNENRENKYENYEDIPIVGQYKLSKQIYKGDEKLKYMGIKEFSERKPLKDINDYLGD